MKDCINLPLYVDYDGEDYTIRDCNGDLFADVYEYEGQTRGKRSERADFIVMACNCFTNIGIPQSLPAADLCACGRKDCAICRYNV